jgi:hypothetical protein
MSATAHLAAGLQSSARREEGESGKILNVDAAFGHHEDRTPTHGYADSREAAMAAFAKSWRRG